MKIYLTINCENKNLNFEASVQLYFAWHRSPQWHMPLRLTAVNRYTI